MVGYAAHYVSVNIAYCGNRIAYVLQGKNTTQLVTLHMFVFVTQILSVTIARRIHLFPYRTQKLSSLTSMILGG